MSVMVEVSGEFLRPDGTPVAGEVAFELIGFGVPTYTTPTYSAGYVSALLDADGKFTMTLLATDDPDIIEPREDFFAYALQLRLDGEFYWRRVLVPSPGPWTVDELPDMPVLANATTAGV